MKIGIFFEYYQNFHEFKDPGQLIFGFLDIGVPAVLITNPKPELKSYKSPFPIVFATREQAQDINYWRNIDVDTIIAYTWLSRHYSKVVSAMKKAGKIVLVKSDTDGRRCFPVPSRRLRVFSIHKKGQSLKDMLRVFLQIVFAKKAVSWLVEHISLVDKVIVESPQAQTNLSYILLYWNKPELLRKIFMIPNPVANDVTNSLVSEKHKQILAIGRWDDILQKNTITMVKTLCSFVRMKPDYKVVILGSGKDLIQKSISKYASTKLNQIFVTAYIPRNKLVDLLKESQILFMPSNWEGLPIVAEESLCMGCSLVGTPIESLHFLTQGGFSGTIAPNFSCNALLSSLFMDVLKWENKIYDPQTISSFWRAKLNRKVIAQNFLQLVEKEK